MLHSASRVGCPAFWCGFVSFHRRLIITARDLWNLFDVFSHVGVNLKTRNGLQLCPFVCFVLAIIWFGLRITYCPVAWRNSCKNISCALSDCAGFKCVVLELTCPLNWWSHHLFKSILKQAHMLKIQYFRFLQWTVFRTCNKMSVQIYCVACTVWLFSWNRSWTLDFVNLRLMGQSF